MSGIVYHVYHPPEPGKTFSVDMPEGHRVCFYGQALGGRPCSLAILHDAPRGSRDQQWLDEDLYVRVSPGALAIHAWWEATPLQLDELDNAHSRQAREAVEQ